jgi:hypothetical protein
VDELQAVGDFEVYHALQSGYRRDLSRYGVKDIDTAAAPGMGGRNETGGLRG